MKIINKAINLIFSKHSQPSHQSAHINDTKNFNVWATIKQIDWLKLTTISILIIQIQVEVEHLEQHQANDYVKGGCKIREEGSHL